jgi:hypothetical protein
LPIGLEARGRWYVEQSIAAFSRHILNVYVSKR